MTCAFDIVSAQGETRTPPWNDFLRPFRNCISSNLHCQSPVLLSLFASRGETFIVGKATILAFNDLIYFVSKSLTRLPSEGGNMHFVGM